MQALIRYQWPENIREVQDVIEHGVLISRGTILNVSIAELNPELNPAPGPSLKRRQSAPHEIFRT